MKSQYSFPERSKKPRLSAPVFLLLSTPKANRSASRPDFPSLCAVVTTTTASNDVPIHFPVIGFLSEGVWGNPFFFRKERVSPALPHSSFIRFVTTTDRPEKISRPEVTLRATTSPILSASFVPTNRPITVQGSSHKACVTVPHVITPVGM